MRKTLSILSLLFLGTTLSAQDLSTRAAGVWVKGGVAQLKEQLTATTDAQTNDVITQVGGMFNIIKKPTLNFALGAQVGLAKIDYKTLAANGSTTFERAGALNSQALDVFGRLSSKMGLFVQAGYQADLSPDDTNVNSDLSNAVKLAVGIDKETSLLSIHAGAGTAITMAREASLGKRNAIEVNLGDIYVADASAALKLGKSIRAGVKAQFVSQTESTVTGGTNKNATVSDAFSNIQLVPFLTYKMPNSPFRLNLRGGVPSEYFERGILQFQDGESLTRLAGLLGVGFEF
jgi:hypothetical protein